MSAQWPWARPWPYLAPGLVGAGRDLALLAGLSPHVCGDLALRGGGGRTRSLPACKLWRGQKVLHLAVLALASLLMWLLGNLFWLREGHALPRRTRMAGVFWC